VYSKTTRLRCDGRRLSTLLRMSLLLKEFAKSVHNQLLFSGVVGQSRGGGKKLKFSDKHLQISDIESYRCSEFQCFNFAHELPNDEGL